MVRVWFAPVSTMANAGNADRRPTANGETATTPAGQRAKTSLARPAAQEHRLGCPAGCGTGHDCGAGLRIEATACDQRCFTVGISTLAYYGEVYGCCPCLIEGGAA